MQTEVRTKANTIEKNRNVVKTAQALVASMNPEGLSSTDWRIDMTRKLQERIDLQQQRDKLQQASFVLCIVPGCQRDNFAAPAKLYFEFAFEGSLMAQAYMCVVFITVT